MNDPDPDFGNPERPPVLAPDRLAFVRRLAENSRHSREVAAVAKTHLLAFEQRLFQAAQALDLGHLGSARAFLEVAQRDFDALLKTLPEV